MLIIYSLFFCITKHVIVCFSFASQGLPILLHLCEWLVVRFHTWLFAHDLANSIPVDFPLWFILLAMCVVQILCGSEYWIDHDFSDCGPHLTHHQHYDDLIRQYFVRGVHDRRQILNGHGNTGAQGIESSSFKLLNVGVVWGKAFREY